YILADRGTYLKYRFGRKNPIDLQVLCEGDNLLMNPYGIIPISSAKHPHTQYEMAMEFISWLISKKGQSIIAGYKLHGKQLFYPDAIK
ncbi:MAG: tungsten ABC transporter substrate-binding protein, partial [Deltaproteobacteria bacterium]|nr:tungsten ABC transporter substrate-binding protein [Deltaproteobacteria bacterium]